MRPKAAPLAVLLSLLGGGALAQGGAGPAAAGAVDPLGLGGEREGHGD